MGPSKGLGVTSCGLMLHNNLIICSESIILLFWDKTCDINGTVTSSPYEFYIVITNENNGNIQDS